MHFLGATGKARTLDWKWLRKFKSVQKAESTNKDRFVKTLKKEASNLSSGKKTILDWWDSQQSASVFTELYYASGTFTITSYGEFELSCAKDGKVKIKGSVDHYWWDPYDWHAGLGASIPGHGYISDKDALALQNAGRADSFLMESTWSESLDGTYEVKKFWFDTSSFNWKNLSGGSSGAKSAVITKYPSAARP